MPGIVLPNCFVWTSRAVYDPTVDATPPNTAYLNKVSGNISPMIGTDYMLLTGAPEPALEVDHMLSIGAGVDIKTGDMIIKITELDGITPWVGSGIDEVPSDPTYENVIWWVRHSRVQAPKILPYRICFLKRTVIGGGGTIA